MEVEMLNLKSTRIAVAVAALVTINPLQAADDWFEQQRSISDGYSPVNTSAGAEGRQGPAASATNNSSWLEQQLSISDGYSPPNEAAETAYVGTKFKPDSNESFMERGRRISDGTPE
jgi:hypothetical protein